MVLKDLSKGDFEMVAKTQQGLEPLLAEELEQLGAAKVEAHKRAVSFVGNLRLLYKVNLYSRLALRVLVPVYKFNARNENQLYERIYEYKWETFMGPDETLAIDGTVNSPFFNHSKYVALKTKDAMVDRFRSTYGRRPSVDTEKPNLRLNLHIFRDECTVAIDSSGDSLHKRGYRDASGMAPLNEVTAAALVILSGWQGEGTFMDGMCGSGTILIEAAMQARNIPAGINREWFGFMGWNIFDPALWNQVKEDAVSRILPSGKAQFIGNDAVYKVIEIARENVAFAGLTNDITLSNKRFEEQKPPPGGGIIIMNPPYGERLALEEINSFYKLIGDTLKKNFTGFDAWILSSNKEALKHVGLAANKRLVVWNGPLECKFHRFGIYQGSQRKQELPQ